MKIELCRHCGQPEYWRKMRWKDGICMCRNCYKRDYERMNHGIPYRWDDLDGPRPTMQEYLDQEERRKRDVKANYGIRSD